MQPNTSYQRTEAEGTATGREIKTKSETERHSSHILILTNLGGRILPEKVKSCRHKTDPDLPQFSASN